MTSSQHARLTPSARRLYGELNYLFDFWKDKRPQRFSGSFFVSDTQLRRVLKYSRSTLKRARLLLIETDMIACTDGVGRGKAITYHLTARFQTETTQNNPQKDGLPAISLESVLYLIKTMGKQEAIASYVSHGYKMNDILALIEGKC